MSLDKRLAQVNAEEKAALSEIEKTFGGMINSTDKVYDQQIANEKAWLEKQQQLQQEKTDFAIHEINQQKEQLKKDYQKEQSAAYVDYQKGINPYGVNSEQAAAAGMANSGYSESSQVRMYTAYQNRVAVARESYNFAVQNFNNSITEAKLQNNSILAEIAYKAQQTALSLGMQEIVSENELKINKLNTKLEVDKTYKDYYMNVLQQINQEEVLEEQKRQFNTEMQFKEKQFRWQQQQAAKASSGGGGGGKKSSGSSKSSGKSSGKSSSSSSISKNSSSGSVNKSSSKSSEPTVNMSSVLALGYGPISASKLNSLVSSGKVQEYEKNGQLYYKKVFNYK